jgi:hypothetical protein
MGFFDKLKEQASGLGAQLDDALKGTKGSAQLNSLNKQRDELVKQLGSMALDQFRSGALDEAALRAQAEQVFGVERQIIQLQQEIEAQKQAAAAARAAAAPGAAAPAPPAGGMQAPPAPPAPPPPPPAAAPAQPATVACAGCGKEIPADAAFCPECGARRG